MTPFGKLTPEEQGALLLAERNGEDIEIYGHCEWRLAFVALWYNNMSYRIKPKPKMQGEYWVVFKNNGRPIGWSSREPQSDAGYYKVHHPAVEIKKGNI